MANRINIRMRERVLFMVLVFTYFCINLSESTHFAISFNDAHLSDFIFIPLLMTAIKIVRWIFGLSFIISNKEVFIATLYSTCVFEWFLPNLSDTYVNDPLDILAYFLGAVGYLIFTTVNFPNKIKHKIKI